MRSYPSFLLLLAMTLLSAGCAATRAPERAGHLRPGRRIVFLGDSITQAGAQKGGYVQMIADTLRARYPSYGITVTGAGISGNKITDLLARLDRDVLALRPDLVVVYIGINDVWHWKLPNHTGTTLEAFEAGMTTLTQRLRDAGAEVVVCTPSVIGEKTSGNPLGLELDRYADAGRRVARRMNLDVCDLRQAFTAHLKQRNTADAEKGILTTDGVHLNAAGNRFVADQIFQTLTSRARK